MRGDYPERAAVRRDGPGRPAARAPERDTPPARPAGRRTCRRHGAGVPARGGGDLIARVQQTADGVPFLVEELLASPGVPRSFADTVRARLADLGDDERLVLHTAAVLGRQFDWRLLPSATGLPAGVVSGALERGVGSMLLAVDGDAFRFRHALTREAVAGELLPPRRCGPRRGRARGRRCGPPGAARLVARSRRGPGRPVRRPGAGRRAPDRIWPGIARPGRAGHRDRHALARRADAGRPPTRAPRRRRCSSRRWRWPDGWTRR